jgi:hypothetical protein
VRRAAEGAGSQWLGLTNGVNSGVNSGYQSLGIERDIPTIDSATYTFSLAYAGALGLAAANTRIGVYVDGIQVGSYAGASSDTALNWEALTFTFKGNGKPRSLRIQLEGGADTSTAKGAMIDALKVVETLPNSSNVAYGFVNGTVMLPVIGAKLADGDTDASLKTELTGLPEGAVLSDGTHLVTIGCDMPSLDVSAWNLAALVLTPPRDFTGLKARTIGITLPDGHCCGHIAGFFFKLLALRHRRKQLALDVCRNGNTSIPVPGYAHAGARKSPLAGSERQGK